MDRLVCHYGCKVEHGIHQVTLENVSGHVFGRRHVFERRTREYLSSKLCLSNLQKKAVFEIRIDFICVSESDLFVAHPRPVGEGFVDKL